MICHTDIVLGIKARQNVEFNSNELLRIKNLSVLTCKNIGKADDRMNGCAFTMYHTWLNQLK